MTRFPGPRLDWFTAPGTPGVARYALELVVVGAAYLALAKLGSISAAAIEPGAIPMRAILAFGSERRGLSPALRARAARRIAIPMRQGVSSLNLATAVAVVLYAWRLGLHRT